jgi:signal transduction histidine kinase
VLQRDRSVLRARITDDGKGIPASFRAGVGLGSMRERAAELGGICVISGEPGAGTRVEVMFPLLSAPSEVPA